MDQNAINFYESNPIEILSNSYYDGIVPAKLR